MIYLVTQQIVESPLYEVISVEKSLSLLKQISVVGVDTETQGFDPFKDELLLLQLGCYEFQIVIDCTTVDVLLYKEYLESNRTFIFWNA
jgi:ribonuclease D